MRSMVSHQNSEYTRWISECEVPGGLISYIYRMCVVKFSEELAPYGIGSGEFPILITIYEEPGKSQDELAILKGFDKSMIAKMVVKLEEKGLMYRIIDPDDKRVKRMYLTDAGKALYPKINRVGINLNQLLHQNLSESESRTLLVSLKKMALNAAEM